MLKRLLLFCSLIFFVTLATGCGGPKKVNKSFKNTATGNVSVLSLRGDTHDMTPDQIRALQRVSLWMDRDIIKQLNKAGFKATLIKSRNDFKGPGHLLVVEVAKFNPGNRASRAFVGFGAGAASLDLQYQLLDRRGKVVSSWNDGVGSSKGGTYCAQTLNRNAITQLTSILNK